MPRVQVLLPLPPGKGLEPFRAPGLFLCQNKRPRPGIFPKWANFPKHTCCRSGGYVFCLRKKFRLRHAARAEGCGSPVETSRARREKHRPSRQARTSPSAPATRQGPGAISCSRSFLMSKQTSAPWDISKVGKLSKTYLLQKRWVCFLTCIREKINPIRF